MQRYKKIVHRYMAGRKIKWYYADMYTLRENINEGIKIIAILSKKEA